MSDGIAVSSLLVDDDDSSMDDTSRPSASVLHLHNKEICFACKKKFTKDQTAHRVCLVCENGYIHQDCLQRLILSRGHNRCPGCINSPMLLENSNTPIFRAYLTLSWFINFKNQMIFVFALLFISFMAVLLIHFFIKFLITVANVHLSSVMSHPNINGTTNTTIAINDLVPCYPDSLRSYLFCYNQSLFTNFDFVWVLLFWVGLLLVAFILVLILNVCKHEREMVKESNLVLYKSEQLLRSDPGFVGDEINLSVTELQKNTPTERKNDTEPSVAYYVVSTPDKSGGKALPKVVNIPQNPKSKEPFTKLIDGLLKIYVKATRTIAENSDEGHALTYSAKIQSIDAESDTDSKKDDDEEAGEL